MDEPTFRLEGILEQPDFIKLNEFLKNNTPVNPNAHTIPVFQCKLSKGGKHFALKLLLFTDNSYEITLNNISDNEKNRLLKQEMTNNIAHELKTPVSSIRGYIETLLEQPDITPDKQHFFLERTYSQVVQAFRPDPGYRFNHQNGRSFGAFPKRTKLTYHNDRTGGYRMT